MVVVDLLVAAVGSMVDRLGHPRMEEVLQKVVDRQVVAVDIPAARSMAGRSLWEVEVPVAMEELGPELVCAGQEQFLALAAASGDVWCLHSFQSSHEVGGLGEELQLKRGLGPFVHPGLPGEPLVWRIEHGMALNHNFGERRWKASENGGYYPQNDTTFV